MRKIIIDALLSFLLLIGSPSFAQQLKSHRIFIGEKMPDIVLEHFYNQPGKKINLFDLKKKLIILDFWNIWCSACITSFPKMDSLQRKFNDQIQILLVTSNNAAEVRRIFSKPFLQNVNLPIISGDSLLLKLFPHESVPHHIWLNDSGVVKYITYGYNTNEKSITDYLAGHKPILAYKSEEDNLDFSKPLWAKENEAFAQHVRYYSYSSGWLSEYGGGGKSRFLDSTLDVIGLRFINESLLSLYQTAFGGFDGGEFRYPNRIILEVPAHELFYSPSDNHNIDGWNAQNLVCYEISVPLSKKDDLFKLMQHDMDRYFDYCVNVEKRMMKSLCLIRTSIRDKLKSNTTTRKIIQTDSSLVIDNEYLDKSLIGRLRFANSALKNPVLDETGYSGKVDMKLYCSLSDIFSLRRELQKYDLDLVHEEREIDMLVIKEKNTCCGSHNRY
jgi:thiol-disulfide isomerase/thioredoxin